MGRVAAILSALLFFSLNSIHVRSALADQMADSAIVAELKDFLSESYPDISIQINPWRTGESQKAIYFEESKFSVLYPAQRHHYLIHLIPEEFCTKYLSEMIWVELAPGETVEDSLYPDDELIESISQDVLRVLHSAGFFPALDNLLCPEDTTVEPPVCWGDFRHTKRILREKGFGKRGEIDEVFDVCHVLMARGGFCECEVLYNVADKSRYRTKYWESRRKQH